MSSTHRLRSGYLLLAFFLSGMSALIFEVLWVRQLTLALGHTTLAVSVVLSAFMAGLAIGSAAGGKWADKLSASQLLLAYAALELGIGLTGLLSEVFIKIANSFVPRLGLWSGSDITHNALWFLISFLPLLLPTLLMGATLPLLVRWRQISFGAEESSNAVGLLYGLNTLGAVVGTALAGFMLVPSYGLTHCYQIASSLNFLSGILGFTAAFMSRRSTAERATLAIKRQKTPAGPFKEWKTAAVLFLTGTAAMICEVAWTRLFSLVIGSSTYAFTVMLLTFLLGLALGSLLFKRAQLLLEISWKNFSWLLLLIGAGILAYLPLFNKLPYYYSRLFPLTAPGPEYVHLIQFLLCALVMILPTTFMGIILPWATSALRADEVHEGSAFGACYSANTIGGIVGSVLAGLLFIPLWSGEHAILIAVWIYVGTAVFLFLTNPTMKFQQRGGLSVLAVVVFFMGTLLRPPLNPLVVSSGAFLYAPDYMRMPTYQDFLNDVSENKVLFHADGISSTITVLETQWGDRFLRVNGKTDASSRRDMDTQLLLGYLALAMHPGEPKEALLIGLGSGVSVSALASNSSFEKIDCVEIEPAMTKAAGYFSDVNRDVLKDPRLRIINTDGRHYLMANEKKYDIISSEPSNPWIAGVANLFTIESFEVSRKSLKPNGIFCQWFHSYAMGLDDFKMVLHTFSTVFPHVLLFTTGDKDFFLIGSNEPLPVDYKHLESTYAKNNAMRTDLAQLGFPHPFTLIATTFLLDDEDFRNFSEGSPVHTDEHPTLEFSAPHFLHRGQDRMILEALMTAKKNFLPTHLTGINASKKEWGLLYNLAGESFLRSHQLEQAEAAFSKAMASDPASARTWVNTGRVHNLKNEHLKAEKAFNRSIELDPTYALAWFHLGMLYLEQGLEDNGLRSLEEGLKRAPGDPMGTLQLASLYWKRGKSGEAMEIIKAALKRPIRSSELYTSLVQLLNAIKQSPEKPLASTQI